MDEEVYIISFQAGSSGRFLGNIVWGTLKDVVYTYHLSKFNSAHKQSPWGTSYSIDNLPSYIDRLQRWRYPNLYNYVTILEDPALIVVHMPPDFEKVYSRFPNAKIIVISYTIDDIPEIISNNLLKNGIEYFVDNTSDIPINPDVIFLKKRYKEKFKQDFAGQEIPIDVKKEFFLEYSNILGPKIKSTFYTNPIVPDKYKDRVLILPFHEMMHDKNKVLDKISKITGRTIKDTMVSFYDDYLMGRADLIKNHMPWVNL